MIKKIIDLDKIKTWEDFIFVLRTIGYTIHITDTKEMFDGVFAPLKNYFKEDINYGKKT